MADTYNPNEIAKLKHLNEFARQLNIKLDGGTDPKTARNISSVDVRNSSNSYSVADTDDNTNFTLNWKVSDVPGTSVIVRIFSPSDFVNEYVLPTISRNFTAISKYGSNRFEVNTPIQKVAQTFKMEVYFRENNTLLAKTIKITINVTED